VALGGVSNTEARRAHVTAVNTQLVHAYMERWGSAVAMTG
jgi:hypothetical protein